MSPPVPSKQNFKHCDDYIDDPTAPPVLRTFLAYARSPAHGMWGGSQPKLFATYDGVRYRVTMASRHGDVGLSLDHDRDYGYIKRAPVDALTELGAQP